MSKLLINEPPIELLPTLANHIGLDEAIVLQQVHYWLQNVEKRKVKNNYREEKWWTFSTYEEWQESSFPFWSPQKIGRIFRSLEDQGLLISKQFEKSDWNQRKWYTIDYINLDMFDGIKTERSVILDVNDLKRNDETYDEKYNENDGAVFSHYENNIGVLTSHIRESILDYLDDCSEEWIIEAMNIAVENNARKWSYVKAVLDRWMVDGKTNTNKKPQKGTGIPVAKI